MAKAGLMKGARVKMHRLEKIREAVVLTDSSLVIAGLACKSWPKV